MNIQTELEKPHVYIVARCRSHDVEQLVYVETRLCCLQHLQRNLKTKDGVDIKDIMRFFHGDSRFLPPCHEFESGQQTTTVLDAKHMQAECMSLTTASTANQFL